VRLLLLLLLLLRGRRHQHVKQRQPRAPIVVAVLPAVCRLAVLDEGKEPDGL
jgi:hypothetical protein